MHGGTSGRPEAAAAIWHWRAAPAEAASAASGRRLRGALQALAGLAVGSVIFAFVSRWAGSVVLTIGSAILLSALLSPDGLYVTIEKAFAALGQWVGRALTWLLLMVIFWLFFVPFGRLFRRGRRDSMTRFYEPEATTYWTGRQRGRSASLSRERQY